MYGVVYGVAWDWNFQFWGPDLMLFFVRAVYRYKKEKQSLKDPLCLQNLFCRAK